MAGWGEIILALLAGYGMWNVVQVLWRYFDTQCVRTKTKSFRPAAEYSQNDDVTTLVSSAPSLPLVPVDQVEDVRLLEDGTQLNVVLLGTTGAGKSATGNMLLGHAKFESSPNRESVTGECSVDEVNIFGTRLVVVDTPGILDTNMPEDDLKVMLKECTHLACPGVHAFLYLMKIGERDIGGKDKKTFDLLTKMFGEEFLNYTIIVFSAKDCLGDDTLNQIVSDLPDACQKFINSCKEGYLAISNNSATDEKVQAARQVVNKVKDLVQENDGGSYVNALFDEENEKIQERMDHILKLNEDNENKIQNAEREKQSFIESFRDNKPTIDQSEQLQIMEYNILQLRKKSIDRKGARLAASNEIEYDKIVKQFITGVVVAGGVAAGVSTAAVVGGLACIVAAIGFAVIEMRFI